MTDLDKLIEAMETGQHIKRDLIWSVFGRSAIGEGWPFSYLLDLVCYPENIRALGAAMALHKALVPDRDWAITNEGSHGGYPNGPLAVVSTNPSEDDEGVESSSTSPARAWAVAILKAYRAKTEAGR